MLATNTQLQQVAACERWVAQLRSNLAVLAEKCGGLEEANRTAVRSSSAPYYRELGEQHAALMVSVRPLLMPAKSSALGSSTDRAIASRGHREHQPSALQTMCMDKGESQKADARVRFHDIQMARGAAESPLGARPSSDSRLREGAYGSPDGPLQPSWESPERQESARSPEAPASGGNESVTSDATEEADGEANAQGNSSTEPLGAVDRVEMIRSQAVALASSIGASLGSLLGGRSPSPTASASPKAPSSAAGSRERHSQSQAKTSARRSEKASLAVAPPDLPERSHTSAHRSASAPSLHSYRGVPSVTDDATRGSASSRAISDVWARYHPSRSGGATPAWWQHPAPLPSEPYSWATNSRAAVPGTQFPWPSSLHEGPRPLPLLPSSSSWQFGTRPAISTPLMSGGVPHTGSIRY